jgi:hypothetical protein
MREPKTCPKCGTPQQWEMWRHCACGYDFGPGEIPAGAEAQSTASKQEPEEELLDWLTEERFARFLRRVGIGIVIAFLLTHFIYPMDWLTNAAAFVFLFTCWEPSWLWKRKS